MTRAWVEVDVGALCRNGAAIAARAGVPILPIVSADGYGLGGLRAALALDSLDPWGFGVATVAEGEELRRGGIGRPIVVLTPILRTEIDALRRADLTPALGDPAVIESWARTGRPWHLQIDTGVSRVGMPWTRVAEHRELFTRSAPAGALTNLQGAADGDVSLEAHEQRLADALASLPQRPDVVHVDCASALARRGTSTWTMCRSGIFLYGASAQDDGGGDPEPVASMRARIVELRAIEATSSDGERGIRRIATVPVGYADGYRCVGEAEGSALLHGRRVRVAGRVAMDMTMLDVTHTDAALGDCVTLLGRDGDDVITVNELAAFGAITSYEVLTGLRLRLPRRYRGQEAAEAVA